MRRRWHLVGAFDRFNYGDLLFPHLLRGALEALGEDVETPCWSTRAADLRRHGGVVCGALEELRRTAGADDAVVLVGGEVLAARWTGTLRALTGPRRSLALGLAARTLGAGTTDALARRLLRGSTPQPWVLGPDDVGGAALAYDAVGGQGLAALPRALRIQARERLAAATFLAVRDRASHLTLDEWGLEARLAPDPAALVAELFPSSRLAPWLSPEVARLLAGLEGGYMVFQGGRFPLRGLLPVVAQQLRRLVAATGLPLLLLPLGLAAGHEDLHPLGILAHELEGALPAPVPWLVPVRTIWDQMAVIAGARLFAGTSLHGNLTAAAFAVPTVGLGRRVGKLESFLEDWLGDRPTAGGGRGCAAPENLYDELRAALEEPAESRRLRARRLAEAGWDHARGLVAALR